MKTIKAEIRNLTRDDAILLMVDSNLQRTKILPSEKAFAYKMRLDAMKRTAGRPSKDNSSPVGIDFRGKQSLDVLGDEIGESRNQIHRYIRLTNLVPDLLNMVDEGRIALRPAVELSYLLPKEQDSLVETIAYLDATPSLAQAIKMREFSKNGQLSPEVILSILSEEKPNQRERITFRADHIRKFIPPSIPAWETEKYVLQALEHYRSVWEKERKKAHIPHPR